MGKIEYKTICFKKAKEDYQKYYDAYMIQSDESMSIESIINSVLLIESMRLAISYWIEIIENDYERFDEYDSFISGIYLLKYLVYDIDVSKIKEDGMTLSIKPTTITQFTIEITPDFMFGDIELIPDITLFYLKDLKNYITEIKGKSILKVLQEMDCILNRYLRVLPYDFL